MDEIEFYCGELRSYDFPKAEVGKYLAEAATPPRGHEGQDMRAVHAAFEKMERNEGDLLGAEDVAALACMKAEMVRLVTWASNGCPGRRSSWPIGEGALAYLQDYDPEREDEELQEVDSAIFTFLGDDLLSDEQKAEMIPALTGIGAGGVQSVLWNALILAVLFLGGFNYLLLQGGADRNAPPDEPLQAVQLGTVEEKEDVEQIRVAPGLYQGSNPLPGSGGIR